MPQLRTLRCQPRGNARDCLGPLTQLPLLTGLGLEASGLHGQPDDYDAVAGCRILRRLSLCSVSEFVCGSLLLAPGLRQLQMLALMQIPRCAFEPQADWAAVCANLRSVRRLTLDRVDSTYAENILAAVAAGGCLQLRRLRIAPAVLHHSNVWTDAIDPHSCGSLPAGAISALLERRPDVRVELRVGFGVAGVAASWLLPLRAERDWRTAVPQWTDFEVLRSLRYSHSRWTPTFADDRLGRESPHEED